MAMLHVTKCEKNTAVLFWKYGHVGAEAHHTDAHAGNASLKPACNVLRSPPNLY